MLASLRSVQRDNQIGKSIDDVWLLIETWRSVDHSESPKPRQYPVKFAQLALEAAEYGKCNQARYLWA